MIKVKRFTLKEELDKYIESLTSKIDFKSEYAIKDSEYKNIAQNNIICEYFYYNYFTNSGNIKELTYITLTDNNIYYVIYDHKGLMATILLAQLQNWDYLKNLKFKEAFYSVNYKNKIISIKSNIDYILICNYQQLDKVFEALEYIQGLKRLCNKLANQI
jgi:hypothetical protein